MALYDFDSELYKKVLRRAVGDEPLTHFAARAHIAAGNFSRICRGQRATPDILKKIADASEHASYNELLLAAGYMKPNFNLPEVEILKAEEPRMQQVTRIVDIPTVRDFPETKEALKTDKTVTWEKYYDNIFGSGDYIFFIVPDDALAPRINKGETVLVDLSIKPEDGDVALLRFKGKPAILRKIVDKGKKYLIFGNDSGNYPMTEVKASEVEILGKGVSGFVGL